jgi:hypothetical protein
MPSTIEGLGHFVVGVILEEPVELGEYFGVGLSGLVAGERDGHDEAGGLATAEADVEMDLVGLGDGDVLDEQASDAFAFPGGGGGVGPQFGEVGGQRSDSRLVFVGERGAGRRAGSLVVLFGCVELS